MSKSILYLFSVNFVSNFACCCFIGKESTPYRIIVGLWDGASLESQTRPSCQCSQSHFRSRCCRGGVDAEACRLAFASPEYPCLLIYGSFHQELV